MRQVIGLAEKLADNDQERFIFITERGFMPHSKKRKGGQYKRRQVRYCLAAAERMGILTPARRIRRGVPRLGFIVAAHDTVATTSGSRCVLNPISSKGAARAVGQRRNSGVLYMNASEDVQSASYDDQSASSVASDQAQGAPECASGLEAECLSNCPCGEDSDFLETVDSEDLADFGNDRKAVNAKQNDDAEPVIPVNLTHLSL
jgi:hypothetical protein